MLLLDEPFGALDAKVRKELRRWLRRLHDEIHITSVFVTHDQEEALEVADRVVVMNQGRIEQVGTPEEVYDQPATPFVYDFLGNVNLFHGRIDRGRVMVGTSELEAPPEFADARPGASPTSDPRHSCAVLQRPPPIEAQFRHIRAFGPVRLDWTAGQGAHRGGDAPGAVPQRGLRRGQRVFVSPTSVRVFAQHDGQEEPPAAPESFPGGPR